MRAPLLTLALAAVVLAPSAQAVDLPANHPPVAGIPAADVQFFESRIRPILVDKCYKCHSKESDKVRGGLLLDSREATLQGGNTGPALVPGKPDESLLIQAVRYKDEDLQMPPKGEKLSDAQIADLVEWVRRGAPDPRIIAAKGAKPAGTGRNHWAFQAVTKPAVPAVKKGDWATNPIDSFILAKMEEKGLSPNSPADKTTLMRRLYFDLIGLPPHPLEVQNFVKDDSPDAYEKVVDRLLNSPQYGEHWARHWLDVARYSDTKGDAPRQDDNRYAHAWTYRDWVIDAFNADLPYNQFIIAQLAGDRLQAAIEKQAKDKNLGKPETRSMLPALGFLTLGNQFNGRRDDIIADQIDVTTKAFLGLTVTCARCHDHKFDPVPIKDYYSLYGVFANTAQPSVLPTLQTTLPKSADYLDYLEKSAALDKRAADLKKEQADFRAATKSAGGKAKGTAGRVDPQKRQQLQRMERELQRDITSLEIEHPGAPARANAVEDVQRPRDYPVLLRGEANNKGDIVPRRFLEVVSPDPKRRPEWREGSGRWQLALAIADAKNPLTARVLVNRIWQQHWGRGFVDTPDDLGNMSSPPTHPELLDWLAATFVENKWSQKALHKMIVMSSAYRQSSANNALHAEIDPYNRLLWRYNLRRMEFEELHDSLLAITGELDRKYGGKPVQIGAQGFAKRRAVYTMIDRTNTPELLTQFDFPSPDVVTGRRYETTVPQQALFLMNSPMIIETARKLVDRPAFAELKTDEERVTLLYLAIFQRWPTRREVDLGAEYVKRNPAGTEVVLSSDQPPAKTASKKKAVAPKQQGKFSTQIGGVYENKTPLDAWAKLAHALFQSNEATFYH